MKQKATHTEFLEHLLAIEVAGVEARRHAGLLRFAKLPRPLAARGGRDPVGETLPDLRDPHREGA